MVAPILKDIPSDPRCDYDYLRALWEDLLENYILPDGHREVNLPSEVRDRLLGFCSSDLLPHPSELDAAVKIVHELIEDSILPGFLNSHMSPKQSDDGPSAEDLNGLSDSDLLKKFHLLWSAGVQEDGAANVELELILR
ncbi:related to a-agglutinin core protein AGA1 [Fusarium oxysporum]|uniref:Related to a-agglutinin core protein AGA1 n=1 Tax=Fusarium oxysporum TaxID=5507 RepID=A0A2H3TRE8_FUSOX|nr:related to a-agglutinin core protein AGA1 [Fusarium oxysporum]